jgi:hypothetical protein
MTTTIEELTIERDILYDEIRLVLSDKEKDNFDEYWALKRKLSNVEWTLSNRLTEKHGRENFIRFKKGEEALPCPVYNAKWLDFNF